MWHEQEQGRPNLKVEKLVNHQSISGIAEKEIGERGEKRGHNEQSKNSKSISARKEKQEAVYSFCF